MILQTGPAANCAMFGDDACRMVLFTTADVPARAANADAVVLLRPPPLLVGVSMRIERGRQQSDSARMSQAGEQLFWDYGKAYWEGRPALPALPALAAAAEPAPEDGGAAAWPAVPTEGGGGLEEDYNELEELD